MINGSMIIEKITNSNGTAIKFEDGTMIAFMKHLLSASSYSYSLWANGTYYSDVNINHYYPVPFNSIYSITVSSMNSQSSVMLGGNTGTDGYDLEKIKTIRLIKPDNAANNNTYSIIVFGTWK